MQVSTNVNASRLNTTAFVAAHLSLDKRVAKKAVVEVQLNRVNLRSLINQQNGLFVSVDFIKLDGETRTITGRLGVKSVLKGGQNNVESASRPYLTIFDIQLRQYRTVNLSTVSELRAGGKKYVVID